MQNPPCEAEFQSLHDGRRSMLLRFADQQVKMLRHDDVSDDDELVLLSNLLQHLEKQIASPRGSEERLSTVTTASDEVQVVVAIVTRQIPGHVVEDRVGNRLAL